MELNPFGEFGEWIKGASLHNSLPQLSIARQKSVRPVQGESGTNVRHMYQYAKANGTRTMRITLKVQTYRQVKAKRPSYCRSGVIFFVADYLVCLVFRFIFSCVAPLYFFVFLDTSSPPPCVPFYLFSFHCSVLFYHPSDLSSRVSLQVVWYAGLLMFRLRIHCIGCCLAKIMFLCLRCLSLSCSL